MAEFEMVGLEASVEIVLEKLGGARRLGIVGPSGIGKTTVAKAVFDKMFRSFEYSCFLEDVKNKMQDEESPDHLREKIVSGLNDREVVVGGRFSWSELEGKKVLIILDGAEFESQVSVMTKKDNFSEDSRVIVTSRDEGFLQAQGFEIQHFGALSLDDSKRLLCLQAFKQPEALPAYQERVTRLAEKCDGLPLALKAAGGYLYKRNEAAWDDALQKLSLAQPLNGDRNSGLWSILRMSFDSLANSEQQMFLDAATCFHGENLKKVQEAWRFCSWASESAESGWQTLLGRCLVGAVKRRTYYNDEDKVIWVHEVIRDVGREIAGHSRVFDIQEAIQLQKEEKATVKVLNLPHGENHALDTHVLSGMKELEILWLGGYNSLPESLGDLQALRELKIDGGRTLGQDIVSPNSLEAFPNTLGELHNLEHLIISECGDFVALPESVGQLRALRRLEIAWCNSFSGFPNSLGQLQHLEHLKIRGCDSLEVLPNTLGLLHSLEHLTIATCYYLTELPESLGNLLALRHLEITNCDALNGLPNTLGQLQALEFLTISSYLGTLPDTLGELQALQHFEILCPFLTNLPESIGKLSALRYLKIGWCRDLKALPNSIGQLQALARLEIIQLTSLEALPDTLGLLHNLHHLILYQCESLTELPKSVAQLSALCNLDIQGCDSLKGLPSS